MKNLNLNLLKTRNSVNHSLKLVLLIALISIPQFSLSQWIEQSLPVNGGCMLGINFKDSQYGMIGGWKFQPDVTGKALKSSIMLNILKERSDTFLFLNTSLMLFSELSSASKSSIS